MPAVKNVTGPDIEERALRYLGAHSHSDKEGQVLRTITSAVHLLKNNPLLKKIEAMGRLDPDYSQIVHAVRTGMSKKLLPEESEARRLGGVVQVLVNGPGRHHCATGETGCQ